MTRWPWTVKMASVWSSATMRAAPCCASALRQVDAGKLNGSRLEAGRPHESDDLACIQGHGLTAQEGEHARSGMPRGQRRTARQGQQGKNKGGGEADSAAQL